MGTLVSPLAAQDTTAANQSTSKESPGNADVPVGTANEKAKEEAANDEPLTSHSLANGDVGAPRALERCGRVSPHFGKPAGKFPDNNKHMKRSYQGPKWSYQGLKRSYQELKRS